MKCCSNFLFRISQNYVQYYLFLIPELRGNEGNPTGLFRISEFMLSIFLWYNFSTIAVDFVLSFPHFFPVVSLLCVVYPRISFLPNACLFTLMFPSLREWDILPRSYLLSHAYCLTPPHHQPPIINMKLHCMLNVCISGF